MISEEIVSALEGKFGSKIKSKKLDTLDPFVIVEPVDLVAICRFLRDDSRLKFEMLNCVTGVDYLEPDPKKAAKAGFEPHLEMVYHLSSFTHKHRFVVKLILPRPYTEVDLHAVPPVFRPRVGRFELFDDENVFAVDPEHDIFAERGIAPEGAIVVVRPDQYVAHVLPLHATDELRAFLSF